MLESTIVIFLIESVMVVSKAFGTIEGEMKKTSLLRRTFIEIPPYQL
jgi:hypothetical protein